jgi:CDP-diacylglycerol--glycerol-3-phosphate 3-phosphatidyltransferase
MNNKDVKSNRLANVPNAITGFRIVGSAVLLFVPPLSFFFYILYALCGISDAVDGFIARRFKLTGELGAKLDSIADLLFYAVMLTHIIPFLVPRVPHVVWYCVGALVALRLFTYGYATAKYHRFPSLHTYTNKLTGMVLFAVPFLLLFAKATTVSFIACAVVAVSSIEELLIHCRAKEYPSCVKTVFQ